MRSFENKNKKKTRKHNDVFPGSKKTRNTETVFTRSKMVGAKC